VEFWNRTFGKCPSLEYPPPLFQVLKGLRDRAVEISLPVAASAEASEPAVKASRKRPAGHEPVLESTSKRPKYDIDESTVRHAASDPGMWLSQLEELVAKADASLSSNWEATQLELALRQLALLAGRVAQKLQHGT
jgi:hypothetical protein